MNILMVNVPFSGHVNPTLIPAQKLVERGHRVSYILTNRWKDRIEEAGATFIPYRNAADYEIVFKNGKPRNFLHALKAWKYVYNTILEVGDKYDLLIYEFFSFTAFSAAQKRNLKTVRLFSTFAVSRENIGSILVSKNKEINLLKNQFLLKAVTGLICGKIPLVTSNILTEITDVAPDLNLVFTIKEFQEDSPSFSDKFHFVGPLIGKRSNGLVIPFQEMEKSIIYVSLGTLQNQNIGFYKNCMEAFGEKSGVSVIMSVGTNTDIAKLGTIPANFYVYPFVPQLEVLKHSALFITHGGMNSVNEGLFYGNALMVIPLDLDQFAVADRVAKMGLGVMLEMDKVTPELLRTQADCIWADAEITENVSTMRELLQFSDGANKAVDLIEQECKLTGKL